MVPEASKVLSIASKETNHAPISEHQIVADCQKCGALRRLPSAVQSVEGQERIYRCGDCNDILVIVRRPNPGGIKLPETGYRFGDWSIANPVDIFIEVDGGSIRFQGIINATLRDALLKKGGEVDKPG